MTEIKQDHFYGRGSSDDMISILNCADGLSGISGCEMSKGCTSGVGLSIRCRTYVSLFISTYRRIELHNLNDNNVEDDTCVSFVISRIH